MLTHPDYLHPGDGRGGAEEYSGDLYSGFLKYVRNTYSGKYYHILPRELAEFWKENYRNTGIPEAGSGTE
jgi:hypothetical protein